MVPAAHAFYHVDMDGLDAIFKASSKTWRGGPDRFYSSAVDASLAFFDAQGARATYFVIAQDLDDPDKRASIDAVVRAGHRIASHTVSHRYLDALSAADLRIEIVEGRERLEQTFGAAVVGFRAPGYRIDHRALRLLADSGFRYDSSVFPTDLFRRRLGIDQLSAEPFRILPDSDFYEIPMPAPVRGLPNWFPCYASYMGRWYFRLNMAAHARRYRTLTVLFHLTDFGARTPHDGGWVIDLYANNWRTAAAKRRFNDRIGADVQSRFTVITTEEFLGA